MLTNKKNKVLFDHAIVIGYGSIGKKHASYLYQISRRLTLIDPSFNGHKKTKGQLPFKHVSVFRNFNEVQLKFSEKDIVVVSNWGPDHYETVKAVVAKGAKQILLEKPCVNSLEEADLLVRLVAKSSIKIVVNQGWFSSNLGRRVTKLGKSLGLGEVVSIWVNGGARCLSTAGSHWISLSNEIFNETPSTIVSDLKHDFINPRSKTLLYVEGVVSFKYPSEKRLSISLTNLSAIQGNFELLWKNAYGILEGENLIIYKINNAKVSNKVTLYSKPTELVFEGKVPGYFDDNADGLGSLYDSFQKFNAIEHSKNLDRHLITTKLTIMALIANDLKKNLNFQGRIVRKYYKKKYKIS